MTPKLRLEYDADRARLTVLIVLGGRIEGWSFPVDRIVSEGVLEKDLTHILD